jgi:hypothetical protein
MKIDPTSINGPVPTSPGAAPAGTARTDGNRAASGAPVDSAERNSKDQVQISNLLESLRRAASPEDNEISPERAAYLDKLTALVQNGDYEVEAQELSARIVDDTVNGIG